MPTSNQPKIEIGAATIAVPLKTVESYFYDEISNEGTLRSDVPLIILSPQNEAGTATPEWTTKILGLIHEARQIAAPPFVNFPVQPPMKLDIGLVDIQVFFKSSEKVLRKLMKSSPNTLMEQNLIHLEKLFQGALHDQMTLAFAVHLFDSKGNFCLHYHNLIFGLRRENKLLAPLDVEPLLAKLHESIKISVVN